MVVYGQQVADFLGRGDDFALVTLAGAHVPVVSAMVKAYTRGAGFDPMLGTPDDALVAVIVSCAARSVTNPEQARQVTVSDYSESPGLFAGWTLPELAILHTYRRRAA